MCTSLRVGWLPSDVAPVRMQRVPSWQGYLWALAAVVVASLVAWAFQDAGLAEANKAIVFLLAIALIAARFGLGPGVFATILGVLAFDFFFVPPYGTFAIADAQFAITFAVMLVVALIISTLAARLRRQVRAARARERRLEALYRLSRELSATSGVHQLASTAQREVSAIFGTDAIIYLPDEERRLDPVVSNTGAAAPDQREQAVAVWAFEHGRLAGAGTDTLPEAAAVHVPMVTPTGTAGILSVYQSDVSPCCHPITDSCWRLLPLK